MTATRRRLARTGLLTAGLLLLAGPAAAHPTFNPNSLPAGQSYSVDLVVPHGCTAGGGAPEVGEDTSPTVEVAVQLSEEVTSFSAGQIEGWDVTAEDGAIVWRDAGGSTTAPIVLPVTIQIRSDVPVGETVHLSVAQECEEGAIVWSARPGEEGSPAAFIEVGEQVGQADGGHADHGDTGTDGDPATGGADDVTDAPDAPDAPDDHAAGAGDAGTDDDHAMDDGDEGHADDGAAGGAEAGAHGEDVALEGAAASSSDGFTGLAILVLVMVVGGITIILRLED